MKLSEKVVLTNMCMIYDDDGNILVQDKLDRSWGGVTFPGGHIEYDESFNDSVIREVKEETGLDIKNPKLCGIKHWKISKKSRYIVLFYKTNEFSGNLQSSNEGKVFWIKKEDLKNYKLADGFETMFKIFDDDNLSEFMSVKENGNWVTKIF
ncbi:MAG: 8-oxo-dGTP diphosphatase [Clostridiales bacterium]|nr:8-oxo-dGTP diphosphatase [Clostridiales bacterium]